MDARWTRRGILAGAGASALAVAGCSGLLPGEDSALDDPGSDGAGPDETGQDPADGDGLPAGCPTSQDLAVAWPDEIDRDTAGSFVAEYEAVYYREGVVGYEPTSRVDSYDLGVRNVEVTSADADGYEVQVSGGGGIYSPHLRLTACVSESPADSDPISADEVDDGRLERLLGEPLENGDESGGCGKNGEGADRRVGPGNEVDRSLDLLESLAGEDLGISGPGDAATLHFRVDGTPVELSVAADRFHGDRLWTASYHVDDRQLRRATGRDTDPEDGELLECRRSG